MKNRITEEDIIKLQKNEVFVFGSNLAGIHGKGAALQAKKFGATYRRSHGLDGNVYGIPTKDQNLKILQLDRIQKYIDNFIFDASNYTEKIFLVTKIGCGLAGYTPEQIAPLFKEAITIENIHLPEEFWAVLIKRNTNELPGIEMNSINIDSNPFIQEIKK